MSHLKNLKVCLKGTLVACFIHSDSSSSLLLTALDACCFARRWLGVAIGRNLILRRILWHCCDYSARRVSDSSTSIDSELPV